MFSQTFFGGSIGIDISVGSDTCKDKAAYIWIFLDPAQAGPTLGVCCCCCCCCSIVL